jgi:hypothetical protein
MTKTEALQMIDNHKNKLVHPAELLRWTWLRVILLKIPEDEWEKYVEDAVVTLSQ